MKFLFLIGPQAVGKRCLMNKISSRIKIFSFDVVEQIRKIHKESGSRLKVEHWLVLIEKKGFYIICEMLRREFDNIYDGSENVIITGFKDIEKIEYMIMYYRPESYEILYIDADFDLLKSNFENKEQTKTKDKVFMRQLLKEEKEGLKELKEFSIRNIQNFRYYKKTTNEDNIPIYLFETNSKNNELVLSKNYKK